uniref:Acid phosphatase n=1 Tax=Globodera rostochiensis TaxID=31243 RepID=A0A914IAN6_GLORO
MYNHADLENRAAHISLTIFSLLRLSVWGDILPMDFRRVGRRQNARRTKAINQAKWWRRGAGGIFINQKTELETLKFVHVLWRHGVRTPAIEMAKEPREWKQGLGELTTKGMGQLFRLGQWIRRRYDGGFLSPEYNNYELYVRSSDFNRTLMSAQALLAGLYPPRTNKTFTPDLNWQPFPVHTEPREIDRVIFDGTNCDAMVAEEQSVFNSAEVKAIERSNIEFLSFLAAQSGFERMPLPLREMRYVFDPITCIHLNGEGKELPKWANASVIDRIWQLNDISSAYLYNTTKMARFRAGVLFTEILERMKSIQNGFGAKYDSRQRMHAYSAHDTTLAGVLAAFGIRPSPFPRFATALFIELHRMPSAHPPGHSVRLFYRNETDSGTLWEWPIPDCPSPCTLDQLEHARASILTTAEEQNKECGGVRSTKFVWTADDQLASRHREHIYIALVCALSLLCSALFLYIVCRSLMSSHRRKVFSLAPNEKRLEMEENEMRAWQYSINSNNNVAAGRIGAVDRKRRQ